MITIDIGTPLTLNFAKNAFKIEALSLEEESFNPMAIATMQLAQSLQNKLEKGEDFSNDDLENMAKMPENLRQVEIQKIKDVVLVDYNGFFDFVENIQSSAILGQIYNDIAKHLIEDKKK